MTSPISSAAVPGSVVVMGVAGSGKSTLAREVAGRLGWPMIEGDDFHTAENKARMHAGVPLSDVEREGWLRSLADELTRHNHAVLTCSALKRTYRDILRAASSGLVFIFLDIPYEEAQRRLQGRSEHFFPPRLLQSQFETLETPVSESGILRVEAGLPLSLQADQAIQWLTGKA